MLGFLMLASMPLVLMIPGAAREHRLAARGIVPIVPSSTAAAETASTGLPSRI
jgi:hypothetical protein